MGMTSPFIRRVFCRHRAVSFVRNIYGDEINACGGKRSVWRCDSCGSLSYRDELHRPSSAVATGQAPTRTSAPASSEIYSTSDLLMPAHSLGSSSESESDRFSSGGGGDFGGGGASGSWGDSSSSCSDSSSSSSDSSSSSCSSD